MVIKGTGVTTTAVFLMRNNVQLTASPLEFEDFTVSVATDHLDVNTIAAWLETHSRQAGRGRLYGSLGIWPRIKVTRRYHCRPKPLKAG